METNDLPSGFRSQATQILVISRSCFAEDWNARAKLLFWSLDILFYKVLVTVVVVVCEKTLILPWRRREVIYTQIFRTRGLEYARFSQWEQRIFQKAMQTLLSALVASLQGYSSSTAMYINSQIAGKMDQNRTIFGAEGLPVPAFFWNFYFAFCYEWKYYQP